jgi:hypothetical protein
VEMRLRGALHLGLWVFGMLSLFLPSFRPAKGSGLQESLRVEKARRTQPQQQQQIGQPTPHRRTIPARTRTYDRRTVHVETTTT